MNWNTSKQDSAVLEESDVVTLFSHFGGSPATDYRECVREEAAVIAASRWPLLAEIEGLSPDSAISGADVR